MNSSGIQEDKKMENNIIKSVKNIFILKMEIDDNANKEIKKCFRLKLNKMMQSKTKQLGVTSQ